MKAIIVCTNKWKNEKEKKHDHFFAPLACLENGESIFERQLRLLHECGITEFDIVADNHIEQLEEITLQRKYLKVNFQFINEVNAPDFAKIFTLEESALRLGQETLFVGGGMVFGRQFIKDFFKMEYPCVVAGEGIAQALPGDLIIRTFQNFAEEVSPDEVDEQTCLAIKPLMRFQQGTHNIRDIYIQHDRAGLLKEIGDNLDVARIRKPLAINNLFEQNILLNPYSLLKIEQLIKDHNMSKILIVTDSWDRARFLNVCLDSSNVTQVLCQTTGEADEAKIKECVHTFKQEECDSIISFGSDKAINVGKLVRLFAAAGEKTDAYGVDILLKQYIHIAIPLRFDAGSHAIPEADMIKNGVYKRIVHSGLLPDFVILEPKFFNDLEDFDKVSIVLDTVVRLGEAIWAANSHLINREKIQQVLEKSLQNLFDITGGNINITLQAMEAWHMSIKIMNVCGVTTAYKLANWISANYKMPKGCAAMLCAAQFWRYYADNIAKCKTEVSRKQVANALFSIKSILNCYTNYELCEKISFLTTYVGGVESQYSLNKEDIETAVMLKGGTALNNTPIEIPKDTIADLLKKSVESDYLWRKNEQIYCDKSIASLEQFEIYWKRIREDFTIDEIIRVELDILDEVVRICEKNGLAYFLSYETLLGAVQNEGVSKPNYHIEISMPRADWEQFIEICGEQLSDDYFLHSSKNDEHCWFSHLRVCKKNTYSETNFDRFFQSRYKAIFINIRPMHAARKSSGIVLQSRHKIYKLIDAIILCKLNPASKRLTRKGQLFFWFMQPFSIRQLHHVVFWLQGKKEKGDFGVIGYQFSARQETIPLKWIYPLKKKHFEGREYSVPQNAQAFLERLYCKDLEMQDTIVAPKPIRVVFDKPKRKISFTNLESVSKLAQASVGSKGRLVKLVRKTLGRSAKVFDHTKTRITGAARSIGLRFSKNSKKLAALKNKYSGQRCFLIGNGPSLVAEDLDRMVNECTFGCNLIHKIYEQTNWRPTFLCISDSGITRTNSQQIMDNLDGSSLLIREFAYRYLHKKPLDAIQLPYISVESYKVRGNILAYHYISHATVMSMMLELAFYMGFKEIYLVGLDGTSASAKGSHFTDNYFTKAMKAYGDGVKKRLYKNYDPMERAAYLQRRSLDIFAQLKEFAEKHDIKIYNATRGGYVEVFERANLDEVLNEGK